MLFRLVLKIDFGGVSIHDNFVHHFCLFQTIETHCPDGNCPAGLICYGGTKCNAFDMTHEPTLSPSVSPTTSPTPRPTGPTQVRVILSIRKIFVFIAHIDWPHR